MFFGDDLGEDIAQLEKMFAGLTDLFKLLRARSRSECTHVVQTVADLHEDRTPQTTGLEARVVACLGELILCEQADSPGNILPEV